MPQEGHDLVGIVPRRHSFQHPLDAGPKCLRQCGHLLDIADHDEDQSLVVSDSLQKAKTTLYAVIGRIRRPSATVIVGFHEWRSLVWRADVECDDGIQQETGAGHIEFCESPERMLDVGRGPRPPLHLVGPKVLSYLV